MGLDTTKREVGGTGRIRGRRKGNQSILCEKKSIFNKRKIENCKI